MRFSGNEVSFSRSLAEDSFSSRLIAKRRNPFSRNCISSILRLGISWIQGPHQLAQKLIKTTSPLFFLSEVFTPLRISYSISGASFPSSSDRNRKPSEESR